MNASRKLRTRGLKIALNTEKPEKRIRSWEVSRASPIPATTPKVPEGDFQLGPGAVVVWPRVWRPGLRRPPPVVMWEGPPASPTGASPPGSRRRVPERPPHLLRSLRLLPPAEGGVQSPEPPQPAKPEDPRGQGGWAGPGRRQGRRSGKHKARAPGSAGRDAQARARG